jgi:hypothetical protein
VRSLGFIVHPVLMNVFTTVLSVVQEKINNPSAEDPFEPEIAAVSAQKTYKGGRSGPNSYCIQQLKNDKAAFLSTAREWTKK